MISIITVNWNSYDFLELLIESLDRFSHVAHELVVIDNSIHKRTVSRKNVRWVPQETNIGHGCGLNEGVKESNKRFPFLMFLDVDVHFIQHRWEGYFLKKMKDFDVIGAKGVPEKPIRPACMFMKRELGRHDWKPTEGYRGHRVTPDGYDVAIAAYHNMVKDGTKIGFMESFPNRYDTLTGEEWGLDGQPLVYHHWHGSHLTERQVDFEEPLDVEKAKLFEKIQWRLP